jgi:SH3-like domain-containing protein
MVVRACLQALSGAAAALFLMIATAAAAETPLGPVSKLPLPRFVSLKTDKVNVRQGPTKEHGVAWIFQRAGLPVEITAEFEVWRRIRDSDGAEGWVYHSLLSGRRTALIAPWMKGQVVSLHSSARPDSPITAKLEPGVLANISECNGTWCEISGGGFQGFIQQERLWGVYPGEAFD